MGSKRLAVMGLAGLIIGVSPYAAAQPSLGKAWSFAVLGRSVVNSGDTLITGDLGFTDSNNVTKEMLRLGAIMPKNAARQALGEAAAAFTNIDLEPCVSKALPATLDTGICARAGQLPDLLTLDGPASAVWIIRVNGDLTTARNTAVRITGGGHDWNVFWFVRGDVHLGERTVFVGSIVAGGTITLDAGVSVAGRAIALGGTVTLTASSVSVCCPAISISPTTLRRGNVGEDYNQTLTALPTLSGSQFYQFDRLNGSLPRELSLLGNGTLSGILREAGDFPFTIIAIDPNRCAGVQPEVLDVCPLRLSPLTLPRGKAREKYEEPVTVSGGSGSYSCDVSGLPEGMTFCPDMTFRGVPTKSGKYKVIVNVTDTITECMVKQEYELVICGITITPGTLPNGTACEQYSAKLDPGCVIGEVTFQTISEAVPAGLSLSPNGVISWQAPTAGNFKFTVRATDTEGCFDEKTYEIKIRPVPVIPILPEALPCGTVGVDYTQQIKATECIGKCTFSADPATPPPPGLSLKSSPDPDSGVLSGKPTTPGCYSFRVWATDSDCPEHAGYRDYTVCICGNLAFVQTSPLPTATFNVPYRLTLQVTGGKGPYRFITDGNRPPWLKLCETGVLSGTPVNTDGVTAMIHGPFPCFTVTATDSMPCCPPAIGEFCVPIRVCSDSITIDTTFLPNGTKGKAYPAAPITVTGGTPPLSLSVVSGSLPPGLTLSGGVLSGPPSATGTFCFGVVATDAGKCSSAPQDYTIVIAEPTCTNGTTIILSPASLQQKPVVGVDYFQQLTTIGGTAPYTFSVSTGALPDGLQLDPTTGVIAGKPITPGLYEFTIIATDKNGCVSTRCPEAIIVQ